MAAPLIVHNAVKRFRQGDREVTALADITLEVAEGAFLAVMGASGSGKSTLLHLMAGLATPDSGSVIIRGKDLSAMNDRQLTLFRRRNIGLVFQSFNLIPTLTAEENIALPLLLDGRGEAEVRPKVRELMESLGLTSRKDHKPDAMSGGEQQRVAIGRALAVKPAFLLADEPTGNVDETMADEVVRMMRDLVAQTGCGLLMVTHSARLAATLDRQVTLHTGLVR